MDFSVLSRSAPRCYRSNVEGALGTVPPEVADARENIDRAVDAAGHLPAGQGAYLPGSACDAFTTGIHVVDVVSAMFYACLAVLAVWAFRHVRNANGDEDNAINEDTAARPEARTAAAAEA